MRLLYACLLPLTLLVIACGDHKDPTQTDKQPGFNLDSVKAQITASNTAYGVSFGKNDSTGFVNSYTDDGCIYPPGFPKMCGKAAIGSFFSGAVKMGIKEIRLTTAEVMGGPGVVVETGAYEVFGDNNVSFEKGKFIVAWKEENGKWKMHRDEWNADTMPTASPK